MAKVIKREELDRKFTEAVAKYMNKGMWIATQSMNGHQGEEGKVDLTDGKSTYRVLMYRESEMFQGVFIIEVRKYDGYATRSHSTLWNHEGELVETVCKVYEIESRRSENVYVETEEEAKAIRELQLERYRGWNNWWRELASFDADKVAKAVRATGKHGYKRVKASDIGKVIRRVDKAQYRVEIWGKASIVIG